MTEKLAIDGGEKTVRGKFPWPIFDETDVQAVADAVRTGAWGDADCSGRVFQFEQEYASYNGSKYALAVVNGSVALRIALLASGVKPGDEVIVPPYTFYATASIVAEANCIPIFADIDPDTYNLDPECVERAITPATRAIIPVHFGGQACDMDRLCAIAEKHNLVIIEDACHAQDAEYKGRKLGSIGKAGCYSFQSSKNLNSGEGGLIVTDDEVMYDLMNSLRNCGRVKDGAWYEHHNLGCNYRLTTLQAALLGSQLKRLDAQTRTRNENGLYLNELLSTIEGIAPLTRGHGETMHSYHLYIFRYDSSKFGDLSKERFCEMLAAEGVPAFRGYPLPLYKQPVFQQKNYMAYLPAAAFNYAGVSCPVCERACEKEAVWITQNALLGTRQDMEDFAAAIRKIQEHALQLA